VAIGLNAEVVEGRGVPRVKEAEVVKVAVNAMAGAVGVAGAEEGEVEAGGVVVVAEEEVAVEEVVAVAEVVAADIARVGLPTRVLHRLKI